MVKTSTGSPIEFLQNRFSESYEKVRVEFKAVSNEARRRRIIAYFLKGIAIFGGLAVAYGLPANLSHAVGGIITVAVGIDLLFSNHQRLLIITEASNAYKNLLGDIEYTYNIKLGKIIRKREEVGDAVTKSKLETLINTLLEKLYNEQKRIKIALQDADLKALKTIKLEHSAAESREKG